VAENSKPHFYITTPIYYVNDVPHIGHAYTTIIADALSRFKKLNGCDVFFLTGTDEHGQKVEKSAAEKGMMPIELADKVVLRFKHLWEKLNIDYDYFIRTTEAIHEQGVQKVFQTLKEKGDIYKDIYKGYYCVSCENFLSEDVPLEEGGYKICPDCEKQANEVSEECYFFRLSSYRQRLLDFYQRNPEFVRPVSRMNEVVSFVRGGLKDLSITRTTVKWGISVPGDPDHSIYVWFDALHNYLTAIGYGWNDALMQKFWPPTVQIIGKDILRFHAVFWPAFLMAAGLELPQTVYGHGWWLKDKTKMSKSRGNVLDPHVILNTFGTDPLRYFLLREIPIGLDGNFSHEGFIHRVNSDLANDLGNLAQRTLTMIKNYFDGRIEEPGEETDKDRELCRAFSPLKERVFAHYEGYAINRALEDIWGYISLVNKYLAENEPWKIAKDPAQRSRLGRILTQAASALRTICYLVYPVMPDSCEKIWSHLGENESLITTAFDKLRFEDYKPSREVRIPPPLFPRVSLKDFLKEEAENRPAAIKKEDKMEQITFDEFKRLDLRVAEILKAEKVEGADKLLRLEVDLGTEKRQLVAGISQEYAPETLIGKKLTIVANLKPAVIRGIESQGMILAADINGRAVIPFYSEDLPPGSKVR